MPVFSKIVDKIRKADTRKKVVQGPQHRANIIAMFKEVIEAAADEFTEDNDTTLADFLDECFEEAVKSTLKNISQGYKDSKNRYK